MNYYNDYIVKCSKFDIDSNIRGTGLKMRLYSWFFVANLIKYFPKDFHPFLPGLEVKFALESAKKCESKIILGGLELD